MKKVLVNKPLHPDALEILNQCEFDVLYPVELPDAEVIKMLPDINGLVLFVGIHMDGALMDTCKKLEVVGRHGVGLDNVDVPAATARGIKVVYTPFGPTESTAEHTFTLMMSIARQVPVIDRATRSGDWNIRDRLITREMQGKSVGIIGFGRIGKRFAQMCRGALDMTVYVYDPYLDASFVENQGAVYMTNLKEMASKVDVLSVHCPLTSETRRMVNAEIFQAMKSSAYLVNAARGPIVDEAALIQTLQSHLIAGAAVDVYDPEPPARDNPLYQLENIVLSPHLASMTEEGRRRMGVTVVEEVLKVLRGEKPAYIANPEVYSRS